MNTVKSMSCILLASVLILAGCDSRVLDFRNAEVVNGKLYEKGGNIGYTGKVTNVPKPVVFDSQPSAPALAKRFGIVMAKFNRERAVDVLLGDSLCEINVYEGVIDGDVTCLVPRSQTVRFEFGFDKGVLDGPYKMYDPEGGHLVVSANFKGGQLHGKHEIFSFRTQKLLYATHWANGIDDGLETTFHAETGNLASELTYNSGKINGVVTTYGPDGKQVVYKASVLEGLKHGTEESFDVATGKPLVYAVWANGKLNGPLKKWDAAGALIADEVYENGVTVSKNSAPSTGGTNAQAEACEDRWMTAFRKQNGQEATVTMDQIIEWSDLCKAGKTPG